MSDDQKVEGAGDEAALDAELESTIADLRAGQDGGTGPAEPKVEAPEGDKPEAGETGPSGEAQPGETSAAEATGEAEIRIPNKGKFESDEAYEKRVELFDLVKRRKAATTPEAKEALNAKISEAKGELKSLGGAARFTKARAEGAPAAEAGKPGEIDPALAADQERLRQLGGATKDDVEAIIQQTHHDAQVRSDLQKFVERHAEFKDEDVREVFFDFVDNNYAWQGKSGKDLTAVLEMAHENMFRPAETVTDRVLKAAKVAEKVSAMHFPGGTGAKTAYAPEMQKSIDELKAAGMSEEKAVELLSD